MSKKAVTNIHVQLCHSRFALCCECDGARFHVWISKETMQIDPDEILYKNPPIGSSGHTKYLRQDGAIGRVVMPAMLAGLKDAYAAAIAEQEAQQEAQFKEAQERMRINRIKEAGPQMLEALEQISHAEAATYDSIQAAINDLVGIARAAIAKATGQ